MEIVRQAKIDQYSKNVFLDFARRLFKSKTACFGAIIVFIMLFCAIFAPLIAPYEYDAQKLEDILKPPSRQHLFGTDEFGRDIFSLIIYGSRISLQVGFVAVGLSLIIGTTLGALAGYYRGVVDFIISGITDIAWAFPTQLLAIAFIAASGPSLANIMITVALVSWSGYCRMVRGQFLSLREQEYIEATRVLCMSDMRIIFKHMMPNSLAPIIIMASLEFPKAIIVESSLSFLGLGVQPPTPSWVPY